MDKKSWKYLNSLNGAEAAKYIKEVVQNGQQKDSEEFFEMLLPKMELYDKYVFWNHSFFNLKTLMMKQVQYWVIRWFEERLETIKLLKDHFIGVEIIRDKLNYEDLPKSAKEELTILRSIRFYNNGKKIDLYSWDGLRAIIQHNCNIERIYSKKLKRSKDTEQESINFVDMLEKKEKELKDLLNKKGNLILDYEP